MIRKHRSRPLGTGFIAAALSLVGSMVTPTAVADTIFTVNGVEVDSTVVDLYFESRLGSSDVQPTPEQRAVLLSELKDIYVLATSARARELAADPELQAQLELQRQGLLAKAAADAFIASVSVSEEEMRAMYDEQVKLAPPLDFKARHILVETQGEATDVIAQLDGGANFEELAKEKSTGPSGPNGGDLGWFSPNQMVAPFSNAVQQLEDGQYSPVPVQTQFGWHVILREDSRDSVPPTFDSVRDELQRQVQNEKFQAHLNTLRSEVQE